MTSTARDLFDDEPDTNAAAAIDARAEDAHWARFFHLESYCKPEFDYEDYAAAYCVGYIGRVQYAGSFDDSEKCLCSNWIRLRGDSRLGLDDAMRAVRAAWDRVEQSGDATPAWGELYEMAGDLAQQQGAAAVPSLNV